MLITAVVSLNHLQHSEVILWRFRVRLWFQKFDHLQEYYGIDENHGNAYQRLDVGTLSTQPRACIELAGCV